MFLDVEEDSSRESSKEVEWRKRINVVVQKWLNIPMRIRKDVKEGE